MIADVVCERGVAAGDGATDHVQGHCHLQARMHVDGIAEDAQGHVHKAQGPRSIKNIKDNGMTRFGQ